jgi:hypothetical protein
MANGNPYVVKQQNQQQQQMPMINPMMFMQGGQGGMGGLFGGGQGGLSGLTGLGGGSTGAGGAASGLGSASGAGAASAASSGGSAASGAGSALASNPVGWIIAAALAQNVAHNKGISSWQAGLKGQAGANIGDYYMKDKWGMEDDNPLYDAAGVLGWGSGGGIFNPSYLNKKIFGETD